MLKENIISLIAGLSLFNCSQQQIKTQRSNLEFGRTDQNTNSKKIPIRSSDSSSEANSANSSSGNSNSQNTTEMKVTRKGRFTIRDW